MHPEVVRTIYSIGKIIYAVIGPFINNMRVEVLKDSECMDWSLVIQHESFHKRNQKSINSDFI